MKTTRYALLATLGLILTVPKLAWADVVTVTVSNETFNGKNACGPSGMALCTQTLNATFQWDNTANAFVAGSLSFSTFGALGSSFNTLGNPFPSSNAVVENFFSSAFSPPSTPALGFVIGETNGQLSIGTYTLISNSITPGTWSGGLNCDLETTCESKYPLITTFNGAQLIGASASSGTLTVTSVAPVPEPSSLLMLGSGTGLLGVGLLLRRRFGVPLFQR